MFVFLKNIFKLSFIIFLFENKAYTFNNWYTKEDFSLELVTDSNGNMLVEVLKNQTNLLYTIHTDLNLPDIIKKRPNIIKQILSILKGPICALSEIIHDTERIKHLKLKLCKYNTLKKFQHHVKHHYGRAKKGIKDFVVKVKDLVPYDHKIAKNILINKWFTSEDADNMFVFNQNILANDGDPSLSINDDNYFYLEEQIIKDNTSIKEFESLIPLLILRRCAQHSFLAKECAIEVRLEKDNKQERREVTIEEFKEIDNWDEITFSTTMVDLSETFGTLIAFRYNKFQNILTLVTFYPIHTEIIDMYYITYNRDFLYGSNKEILQSFDLFEKFTKYYSKRFMDIYYFISSPDKHQIDSMYNLLKILYDTNPSNSYLAFKKNELLSKIESSKQLLCFNKYYRKFVQAKNKINLLWNTLKYEIEKRNNLELVFLYAFLDEYQKNSCYIQQNRASKMFDIIRDNLFCNLNENYFTILTYIMYQDEISMTYIMPILYHFNMNNTTKKIQEFLEETEKTKHTEHTIQEYQITDEFLKYIDFFKNAKCELQKKIYYINQLFNRFYDASINFENRLQNESQNLYKSQKTIAKIAMEYNVQLLPFNTNFDKKPFYKRKYSFEYTLYTHNCINAFLQNNITYINNTIVSDSAKKLYEFIKQTKYQNQYIYTIVSEYNSIVTLYYDMVKNCRIYVE